MAYNREMTGVLALLRAPVVVFFACRRWPGDLLAWRGRSARRGTALALKLGGDNPEKR